MKLNPALTNLPVYLPGKPIEEVARELGLPPETIVKLASNENPLGPSPAARRAMQQAAETINLYPDGSAFHLKRKLAGKLSLDPAHLILGNGSNEIIEFVGHALLDPGAEVIVSQYCFAVYPIVTHLFGAKLVTVPAVDFGHDLKAMLAAVTPRTRVIFVANPNNPTGTACGRAEMIDLINSIPEHVLLVLDEAYIEFQEDPVDLAPLVRHGTRKNILLMRTFSKIFGLAGLRIGYGIGHPELIAAIEKVRQPFNINSIALAGALAALDDMDHLDATRKNNAAGLPRLAMAFTKLGLRFVPSHANFLMVHVGDGLGVFQALQKLGVIVRPMAGYELPEWIRVTVGTPAQNEKFLSALHQVLGR